MAREAIKDVFAGSARTELLGLMRQSLPRTAFVLTCVFRGIPH
jgi:hypothetical protein